VDSIPPPLLDRMDTISLAGYTEEEKLGIARRYLVPKQIEAHGLTADRISIPDETLQLLVREYTREAGVRGLERRIADVCRKAARLVAEGHEGDIAVDEGRVRSWMGPRRFTSEARRRTADAGVATGLAYTATGGDVLFVEAQAYPGKGRLTITGQLGEVMKESAQAALSWVRSHTERLGLAEDWFAEHDLHLHVPAGAVPKDGPSAGITMATAIASLVRGTPVADDLGMTGELTLTGQVLPIGGVREKALAAQRAGLRRVVLPRENEHDLEELPAETRRQLEFVVVDSIEDVFAVAFRDGERYPTLKLAKSSAQAPPGSPPPGA
jgi:ATP-dependent Lon protease